MIRFFLLLFKYDLCILVHTDVVLKFAKGSIYVKKYHT